MSTYTLGWKRSDDGRRERSTHEPFRPAASWAARVPPQPSSMSSGCAPTASTLRICTPPTGPPPPPGDGQHGQQHTEDDDDDGTDPVALRRQADVGTAGAGRRVGRGGDAVDGPGDDGGTGHRGGREGGPVPAEGEVGGLVAVQRG